MQQNLSQICTHQLPHTKPLLVPSKQFFLRLSMVFFSGRTININAATEFTIQHQHAFFNHHSNLPHNFYQYHCQTLILQMHSLFFNRKLSTLQTDFNQIDHCATIPILSTLYQNFGTIPLVISLNQYFKHHQKQIPAIQNTTENQMYQSFTQSQNQQI